MLDPIFHITTDTDWQKALATGEGYATASLSTEGFIHCSTREQVAWVANGRFRGSEPLVLLRLDSEALTSELRWEISEPGMAPFPHIYGPINRTAVKEVIPFPEGPDGFAAPDA